MSSNWDLAETDEGKLDINAQTDAPAISHPSQSAWVTIASGKTEREKGQDWHGTAQREIKAATSCSSGALAPSGCKDGAVGLVSNSTEPAKEMKGARQEQKESRRWKERERRESRRSPPSCSHRADRDTRREATTSDSKMRRKHSPHRRQPNERHAGSRHHRSPSRSKERRRRASGPAQESSRREGRRPTRADEVAAATEEEEAEEDAKWPREELDGGQWEVVDGVDGGWELEEGERPSSGGGKSSSSSTGGRESCSGRKRHRAEKGRASPEPLDDWRPRKHKHRE